MILQKQSNFYEVKEMGVFRLWLSIFLKYRFVSIYRTIFYFHYVIENLFCK